MTRPRTQAHPCFVDGCSNAAFARGWCRKHYERWRKHGDPAITLQGGRPPKQPAAVRGPSDGRLMTVCWCGESFVFIAAHLVRSCRTVSCGGPTCQETA